ncbi:MAG: EAL domain-containing protein [Magnetococcales bacterium]|nr:EAL domain-containing protein [Magnetococcales bacterium]
MMNHHVKDATILIVDDVPNNIRILGKMLDSFTIRYATNGADALKLAFEDPPDLVLLDAMMPEMDGFTVCALLRDDHRTCDIPVIIITAITELEAETRGFAAGAVDFLTKPVHPPTVRARVNAHLTLKKQRDELRKANQELQTEIQRRRILEERLREQAEFDLLTGLPNRSLFMDRLGQAILMSQRNHMLFALLFIDLDRFKWVNDTLGHDAGDTLLIEVSRRLEREIRKSDTVARLGGDEFTVILNHLFHESMAELVARKILEQLNVPFMLKGQSVTISGSIGIALYPSDGTDVDQLTQHADAAMYQSKKSGRNMVQFFSAEINRKTSERLQMEGELRRALANNELYLDYQPKIKTSTGHLTGMEALVRWNHPGRGILFPIHFVKFAEHCGLIFQLGAWVLRTACQEAAKWTNNGLGGLKLAVNLSALQLQNGTRLIELVKECIAESGMLPHQLELEITESMMLNDAKMAADILMQLHEMGISITLDDFGTGHSSLALLRTLPVQTIKIDRSFVTDLKAQSYNANFIGAIISMARNLNLDVVVEGIESAEQLNIMKDCGGDEVQGFYFSPPLGKNSFQDLLDGQLPLGGGLDIPS